ncbi:MAG: hypothetical protein ACLRSW_12205 [Christensenellaceae bacterium]
MFSVRSSARFNDAPSACGKIARAAAGALVRAMKGENKMKARFPAELIAGKAPRLERLTGREKRVL